MPYILRNFDGLGQGAASISPILKPDAPAKDRGHTLPNRRMAFDLFAMCSSPSAASSRTILRWRVRL